MRKPNPRVRVISSQNPRGSTPGVTQIQEVKPKLRTACYARVSTDHEDQESSFEAQKTHFKNMIDNNPEWELAGVYADEESGTQAYKRENFMRMIKDCEDGKIDLILTKSISRWARNTLDSLNYIRKLKRLGIPVIFFKECANTMESSGEMLITILSSIAQNESASISQNVQLGVRYHYQEGKVCSGTHRMLGYNRKKDGTLELVPEEAAVIRRIFREYLDGYTPKHIAERLEDDCVSGDKATVGGGYFKRHWNINGIKYILQNEKYAGDLLLQKYYTVDFLEGRVALNTGQVPQFYVENAHDPIVPKEVFMQVQAEIARRRENPDAVKYSHTMSLSDKMFCGICGSPYVRIKEKNGYSVYYRCKSRTNRIYREESEERMNCTGRGIREEEVMDCVVRAFNELPDRKEELVRLQERLHAAGLEKADEVLRGIEKQIEEVDAEIQRVLSDGAATDYSTNIGYETGGSNITVNDLTAHLRTLQAEWTEAAICRAEYAEKDLQIRNLLDRIENLTGVGNGMTVGIEYGACYDPEQFYRLTRMWFREGAMEVFSHKENQRFVEKITVYLDRLTIRFRAGIEVDVQRKDRISRKEMEKAKKTVITETMDNAGLVD